MQLEYDLVATDTSKPLDQQRIEIIKPLSLAHTKRGSGVIRMGWGMGMI